MNYAVIEVSGKQQKVMSGSVITVDKASVEPSKVISFDKVLLFVGDDEVKIGMPYLNDVVVKGTVLENLKGEKIHILKFRAKSRYRKKIGFRPQLSKIRIDSLEIPSKAKETAKKSEAQAISTVKKARTVRKKVEKQETRKSSA